MLTKKIFACLSLLCVIANAHGSENTAVGVLKGQFDVSPSGAATYTVPIELPPGTAGVQPSLALSYSSQAGNGLLGMGWSLSGLSSIHRCATTLERDGFIDGVDFDDNDKFCLDGMRLVALTGDSGLEGTEYRTEVESFSQVISYNSGQDNDPDYFKVWKKSGEIFYYGSTSDSRVEAQGKTQALSWALNRVEDRYGNYFRIVYHEDNSIGEHYPLRFEYTGNDGTGLAPYNSVELVYEDRPDNTITYIAGTKRQLTKRLIKASINHDSTEIKSYLLGYAANTQNFYKSRLVFLKICEVSGQCLSEKQINWPIYQNHNFSRNGELANSRFLQGSVSQYLSGDFNGDGRTDIAAFNYSSTTFSWVALVNSDGSLTKHQPFTKNEFLQGSVSSYHTGDWNGDGLADIAAMNYSSTLYSWIAVSNGDGTFTKQMPFASAELLQNSYSQYVTGDWNGDGLTDIVALNPTNFGKSGYSWVALSNGDGTFTKQTPFTTGSFPQGTVSDYIVGDWNGDGLADIAAMNYSSTLYSWIALSNGDGTFNKHTPFTNNQFLQGSVSSYYTGDWNGDGLSDIAALNYSGNGMTPYSWIAISHGDGTFTKHMPFINTTFLQGSASRFMSGDFNGDGRTDIAAVNYAGSGMTPYSWIAISNGDNTFTKQMPFSNTLLLQGSASKYLIGDWNGDGLFDLAGLNYSATGNSDYTWLGFSRNSSNSDTSSALQVESITDTYAYAPGIHITYQPLTDNSTYTKIKNAQYPIQDIQTPMYVVSQVETTNGIGGTNTVSYHYAGLKAHMLGLGSLGFAKITKTSQATGIQTVTEYNQNYTHRLAGEIDRQRTILPNGVVLADTVNSWQVIPQSTMHDHGVICRIQLIESSTTNRSLAGDITHTSTTQNSFDDYGNVLEVVDTVADHSYGTYTTATTNQYSNDTDRWILGRLLSASVTKTAPNTASQTRTSSFGYESTTGQLLREVIEPGSANTVTTTYQHDDFGNTIQKTVSWANGADDHIDVDQTVTTSRYDSKGRFKLTDTNALGHSQTYQYDQSLGVLLSTTGPNGLTTYWTYDGFGRKTQEIRPDGTKTIITREWCLYGCPALAVMKVTTETTGSTPVVQYLDALKRTIQTQSTAFDGQTIYTNTEYDALGRVARASEPYFSGELPLWHSTEYDALSRPIKVTAADGSVTQQQYNGLSQTTINALDQSKTVHNNALGWLIQSMDNQGNAISYQYDAYGNNTHTVDPSGNTIEITYDDLGRKTAMHDPDKGDWTYQHNALGQLISQTDALGQVTEMYYDALGRMIQRIDQANQTSAVTSIWTYDTASHGVGKLARVMDTRNGNQHTFQYDTLGRPTVKTQIINDVTYSIQTRYDGFGRVLETIYPNGFSTLNHYNTYGHLTKILPGASNPDAPSFYWELQEADARGNVTQSQLGNGVQTHKSYHAQTGQLTQVKATHGVSTLQHDKFQFDAIGNLTQRQDVMQGRTEYFQYDNLNRLTSSQVNGGTSQTVQYDKLGNITYKSDVGDYLYGAKPHAVIQTSGMLNNSYQYNANGDMTQGAGRTIEYTAFGKPNRIAHSNGNVVHFTYGPNRNRLSRLEYRGSEMISTTYVDGLYEKVITTGSSHHTEHKYYIGGLGLVITDNSGAKQRYFHKDHLGSTVAISDENGQITERFSFDAWGKRRQGDWIGTVDLFSFTSLVSERGFTDHEQIDSVGLIHMNGRVYDPILARFISADPFIQNPSDLQSLNRYSYVANNPLSFTDPSGYFIKKIKKAFKSVRKEIKRRISSLNRERKRYWQKTTGALFRELGRNQVLNTIAHAAACVYGGVAGCVAYAAGSAYAHGASTEDALKVGSITAATAAVWYGVGTGLEKMASTEAITNVYAQKVAGAATHAIVGGAISEATGGSFQEGALSAGFVKAFLSTGVGGTTMNTALAAVVGGTASVLGGGKFANGAITAAFARLYNDCQHGQGCNSTERSKLNPASVGFGTFSISLATVGATGCALTPTCGPLALIGIGASGALGLNSLFGGATGFDALRTSLGKIMPASIAHKIVTFAEFTTGSSGLIKHPAKITTLDAAGAAGTGLSIVNDMKK